MGTVLVPSLPGQANAPARWSCRTLAPFVAWALDPVPIDDAVADNWTRLRIALRDAGKRMPVNDSWIAATAMALGVPVVTQDDDFPDLDELTIVRV